MKPREKQKKSKKGFSILELVIAMFILTVGIVGALKLISSTILISIGTRNLTIASGLAQEGVELVRNIRDNNMLYALADLSRDREVAFKNGFPVSDSNCVFDYSLVYSNPMTASCGDVNYAQDKGKLYLDATRRYTHASTGNTETIFRRFVTISYVTGSTDSTNPDPTGMEIVSHVWWGGSAKPTPCNLSTKCVEVADSLPKRD